MAEHSVQCVNGDLAINVQLCIDLLKLGCEDGVVLQFFPHFGQLEKRVIITSQ